MKIFNKLLGKINTNGPYYGYGHPIIVPKADTPPSPPYRGDRAPEPAYHIPMPKINKDMETIMTDTKKSTKAIGNIGEAKVLAKFVELGIPVYMPFGDNERADLLVEFANKIYKVQIKTASGSNNGAIRFDLTTNTQQSGETHKHVYTSDEIDLFACYSIERDKIYIISANGQHNITIRFDSEQGSPNSNYENDCIIERFIDTKVNPDKYSQDNSVDKVITNNKHDFNARIADNDNPDKVFNVIGSFNTNYSKYNSWKYNKDCDNEFNVDILYKN